MRIQTTLPKTIKLVEFGVALKIKNDESRFLVPVASQVQTVLQSMLSDTLAKMGDPNAWEQHDCAEQYPPHESLTISLEDPLALKIKKIYTEKNLSANPNALNNPSQVDYYFAKFKDTADRKYVGVRRANLFKGPVGKSLMHFASGVLTMLASDTFRLDTEFDFIIFPELIAIHTPKQFEAIADYGEELIRISPQHIAEIAKVVPFVDFDFATKKYESSARMRHLLAAVKSRADVSTITQSMLKKACESQGIELVKIGKKIGPARSQEVDFLELLDRRRYNDPLIETDPSAYRAGARKLIA